MSTTGAAFKDFMEEKQIYLRYLGYVRKSSEDNKERQAASLPEQLYVLEGIKAKHNLTLVDTLQESKSAHKPGREIFNSMLARIENGEANAILTWHPNRLCRNALDAGQLLYLMDEDKLVEIRTPSRTYRNTPEDKFMLTLEFGISKKDSDDKSIVVERGLEKKARDGWRPGVAPQGYLNDKTTESGFRKILTDSERLPFIKKIFELFYKGTSVVEIHRIAKNEWKFRSRQKKRSGGKPLSLSMIYKILTNPFYCGKFEYPEGSGKWYEGAHEKVVTQEMFDEIQVKLGHRSQYKLQHHNFAYTGSMIRCGSCNSSIVAEQKWQCICTKCKLKFSLTKKNKEKCTGCGTLIKNMADPTILHYIYYRCGRKKNPNCREKAERVDRLEKQIDEKLSQIEISPLFMDWAIRQIHKMNDSNKDFTEEAVESIKRAHDGCRAKLTNLLQLKISPANSDSSLISDEKYKEEKDKLEIELKGVEKQLVNTDDRMLQANEEAVKAFTFVARAKERFATDDLKIKRDVFLGLGSHLTLQNKTVGVIAPKYMYTIKKMKEAEPIIAERVAPDNQPEYTHQMETYFASNPTLLRGRESRPA